MTHHPHFLPRGTYNLGNEELRLLQSDTKAELIDAAGTAGMSLLKELFVRQREQDMMEKQKEMEIELARARAGQPTQLNAPQGRQGVVQTLGKAEQLADEYEDLLRSAEEMESCKLCKRLIRGARNRPVSEQQELIPALQEFFSSIEDDTPTDVVAQKMRKHDTLMDLVRSEMGG